MCHPMLPVSSTRRSQTLPNDQSKRQYAATRFALPVRPQRSLPSVEHTLSYFACHRRRWRDNRLRAAGHQEDA